MQTNNWYRTMIDQLNTLAEDLNFTEEQADAMRTFVVCNARDNYKEGNRAGATWAFKQAGERLAEGLTPDAFKYQIENK